MYASLDSIDVRLAPSDGRSRVIQTDHRDSAAVTAEPGLSTLFALIRCLNPLRSHDQPSVIYNCLAEPPALLKRAVAAAGAQLWVGDDVSVLDEGPKPLRVDVDTVNSLATAAMLEVAQRIIHTSGFPDALEGLTATERRFALYGFPDAADDAALWTAVVRLGALTGEALRVARGGTWVYNPTYPGTLPLVYTVRFKGELATANPLGKALKYIREHGDGEEPSGLVKAILAYP